MLTDVLCKSASCPPEKKRARLADSGGLYLEVTPQGSKRWFYKYRIDGVEKRLALGSYPAVTLAAARRARDAAKLAKSEGTDPVVAKKTAKLIEPIAPIQSAEPLPAEAMNVALTGNNGELRSEVVGQKQPSGGLFAGLFGGTSSSSMSLLPETRALDQALAKREAKKQFKVKPEFVPQDVEFTGYDAGTIVIDTSRWMATVHHSSPVRTVMPPMTACTSVETGISHA